MSFASVTIDAGVLAVPSISASSEDAHHYVKTILDWSKYLDERWVDIYMSEHAAEALLEDGLYPIYDQLTQFFNTNGISDYAANDIVLVVNKLLQLTPYFETYFKVRDMLAEQTVTDPDILGPHSGANLQSNLTQCVVLIAILRGYCQRPILEHFLILRHAPSRIVQVQALVHELEHDRTDLNEIPKSPKLFKGDISVCDDFRGLIECLDESEIFRNATDNFGIEIAIRIALYKSRIESQEEPEWKEIPNLRIGRLFHQTAKDICSGQANPFCKRVLRAIVETLEKDKLSAMRALRTGPGGNDPQRMRDKDKAQRRNIDNDYRLHYWQCEDGMIELASVVPHNDFSIPE